MTDLLLGLVGVIVAGFCVVLVDLTIKRAELGATLVFVSAIAQAFWIYNVPSVRLGGMRVGITDLLVVIVLTAAIARCMRLRRFGRYHYWLIMLGVLLLVSLIRGMVADGFSSSVADSRQYLFFVGAALYMATFRPTAGLYDRIGRIWMVTSVLMVLLACVRWLDVFGGISLGVPNEQNGVDTAVRVLDGPYAFFLAGPLLLTIPAWLRREQTRWMKWLSAVLLVVMIVLDRRTAYLALLVGVAVLLLRGRRLKPRAVALVAAAGIVTAAVFAVDVAARDATPPGTVTATGSVTWRIDGWSDVVNSWSASPVNWMIGEPFGTGFARVVEGSDVNTHPHNFYIETMIRAGIGGLLALLALTVGLMRRLWKVLVGGAGLMDPGVMAPLLVMQLIWYLAWIPGLEQGIVTGMAIALCAAGAGRVAASCPAPTIPVSRRGGQDRRVRPDTYAGSAPG